MDYLSFMKINNLKHDLRETLNEIELAFDTEVEFHRVHRQLDAYSCKQFKRELSELDLLLRETSNQLTKKECSLFWEFFAKHVNETFSTLASRLRSGVLLGGK